MKWFVKGTAPNDWSFQLQWFHISNVEFPNILLLIRLIEVSVWLNWNLNVKVVFEWTCSDSLHSLSESQAPQILYLMRSSCCAYLYERLGLLHKDSEIYQVPTIPQQYYCTAGHMFATKSAFQYQRLFSSHFSLSLIPEILRCRFQWRADTISSTGSGSKSPNQAHHTWWQGTNISLEWTGKV